MIPLLLFVAASTFSPGGATALATASGARFGLRRSSSLILGIACALALVAVLAAVGLGELVSRHAVLQSVIKFAGSCYLFWLAYRLGRSGSPSTTIRVAEPVGVSAAFLLLLSNPKSWAMAISAAATFSSTTASPGNLALLLGSCFGIAAVISLTLWCALGIVLGRWLNTDFHWRVFNLLMAALLIASVIPSWLG